MKKYFIACLAFAPLLCFGYVYLYTYNSDFSTSYNRLNLPYSTSETFTNTVYSFYYYNFNGFSATSRGTTHPSRSAVTNSTSSIDYQIGLDSFTYASPFQFPQVSVLYNTAYALYQSGYRSPGLVVFQGGNNPYFNFNFSLIVSDVFSSTNNIFQSLVLSALNSIHASISGINTSINNINVDFTSFQNLYKNQNPLSSSSMSNIVQTAADMSLISEPLRNEWQALVDEYSLPYYDDFPDQRNLAYNSILRSLDSMASVNGVFQGINNASLRDSSNFQDSLNRLGSAFGSGAASHYTTPLTNEMRRMSNDWVNETKSALSNNTQKIKDDLAAWKNQLHGTQTSIDNSAANINNTLNNIAGGSSVVRVNVQNQDIGVTITDPVTIDPTQFNAFSEDLGEAGDYMERLFNEFKWWAWDSPDSWKKGFLDRDLSRLSSNVQEQVSLQHSISNLLADFAFNFTNNTEFAISNALAGFTFSSTNDYLLLSDYADYISTSGLSDLLGFMDDDTYSDLKDELSSIGADDVSSGYGRWWRYYTGLSTIQANSVFKIANLLLDHEKLLKDLKRENTDVVELSDSNVFSELLSKIPSQTHIDNKISELTNSIDQTGFARIRELIPDLTNRLSVASALYDHDFALPTDISFVLIPSDSELNIKERVVHISPSEHYRVFQVLHYGIAFSYCIVNLILLPKFLLLLVRLFDRVWNKSERLIYNSTQS